MADQATPTAPDHTPPRIVSLLPSITEILCDLGLSSSIVGITHECDYPTEFISSGRAKVVTTSDINPRTMTQAEIHQAVCGSLKNGQSLYGIDGEVLRSVRPDVIFTQSLCDVCAVSYPVVLESCAKLLGGGTRDEGSGDARPLSSEGDSREGGSLNPTVISLEPEDLSDCLKTFHVAAKAVGDPSVIAQAEKVTGEIEQGLGRIRDVVKGRTKPRVAFLEWHDPIFCGGHWILDMVDIAGGDYAVPIKPRGRSEAMINEDFVKLDPDVILIGPCGFSLDRTIKDTVKIFGVKDWWRNLRAVKEGRVFALDGNSYYARPGPRLLQGAGIMASCMHGQDVADMLGEDLAPASGYCQITMPMYEQGNRLSCFTEVLQARPLISAARLKPHPSCALFVAWNGVLTLVYEGFPRSLSLAKERINMFMPDGNKENFGSKWPKSTLAAVNDAAEPFTLDEFKRLREICQKYSDMIASANIELEVSQLSVVGYKSRGLEVLNKRVNVDLDVSTKSKAVGAKEKSIVNGVVREWENLDEYFPKVNAPGARINSYREDSNSGFTCIAFLHPLPDKLGQILALFRSAVNEALPGRYSWLEETSAHCTLRSLD